MNSSRTADRPAPAGPPPVATPPPLVAGIWLIARLDLRQRLRLSRTPWVVGVWLLAVYGFVGLGWLATKDVTYGRANINYGLTIVIVLALALVVAPALSASSISGDREHGVLATLQTTLLSPAQIGLGKLLAAWLLALGFLLLAAPVLLLAVVAGGATWGAFAMAVFTMAVVLLAICALGLWISAVTARVVSSVVVTYLASAFLIFGAPLIFATTLPAVTQEEDVEVYTWPPSAVTSLDPAPNACALERRRRTVSHTERTWWLLAPNPFVVVADAAPEAVTSDRGGPGPLRGLSRTVREARRGPVQPVRECWSSDLPPIRSDADTLPSVWPFGFAVYALIAVGGPALAIRRLRTPVQTLARGTRIA